MTSQAADQLLSALLDIARPINPETVLSNRPVGHVVAPFGLCPECCAAFCDEGKDTCEECSK